jgi:hypothetical protein
MGRDGGRSFTLLGAPEIELMSNGGAECLESEDDKQRFLQFVASRIKRLLNKLSLGDKHAFIYFVTGSKDASRYQPLDMDPRLSIYPLCSESHRGVAADEIAPTVCRANHTLFIPLYSHKSVLRSQLTNAIRSACD